MPEHPGEPCAVFVVVERQDGITNAQECGRVLHAMFRRLVAIMVLTVVLPPTPILAVDHFVPATRDEPALYPVGSIVRLRCDGGSEMKRGSIYASEHDVEASLDPNVTMPKEARFVRSGTRLRVSSTRRWQSYTPVSHTKYINYQILRVEPIGGSGWVGYVESLSVDPDFGAKPKDNICE